ncbi:MAG: hypothetical protein ACE5O2_14865 [Armatimonadota bacterium]
MSVAKLTEAQRRHLISSYARICHALRQMEEAAAEGRSPTGVGAPLSPLPDARAEPILTPLRRLKDELGEFASEVASEELRAFQTPQPPDNTLVWLSNLLEAIREAVQTLGPRDMHNYGPLSGPAEEALSRLERRLSRRIETARGSMEAP